MAPSEARKAGREEKSGSGLEDGHPVSLVQPGAIATPIWEKSEAVADELIEGMAEQGAVWGRVSMGGLWFMLLVRPPQG